MPASLPKNSRDLFSNECYYIEAIDLGEITAVKSDIILVKYPKIWSLLQYIHLDILLNSKNTKVQQPKTFH